MIILSKEWPFWNPLFDYFYGFKPTSFESKGVKKGSFLTHFWPIFDPFLTHFWTSFLTFFSKSVGIFIGFCKKPDFLGHPKNDPFLTHFWPLFDQITLFDPFLDPFFLTIFWPFSTIFVVLSLLVLRIEVSKNDPFLTPRGSKWPFLTHFWTPFFDHFLTIFYHFCGFKPTSFESRGFKKWVKNGSKMGRFWQFFQRAYCLVKGFAKNGHFKKCQKSPFLEFLWF